MINSEAATTNPEQERLAQAHANIQPWYHWGPYLSERQWGTVREDYTPNGDAWEAFPHDHARSRTYRWGEDGLLGISDETSRLCFALALWNEADPILKERLFGLTGPEGNHGEDVKEYYFFLDNTPTHSYMKALYKYPQRAFPYEDLLEENRRRGRSKPEYELIDTGVFADDRYFDVMIEYAKVDPQDILIRISATNHGPDAAPLHLLPTLWYRNTWAWGNGGSRPELRATESTPSNTETAKQGFVHANHASTGEYWLAYEQVEKEPQLLFTENESNLQRLWGVANRTPFVKDGIDDAIVHKATGTVNPAGVGTKVAVHYSMLIAPGATETVLLRLSSTQLDAPFVDADEIFKMRQAEADRFYASYGAENMSEDARLVQRQAFAGLLWNKQFYHYNIQQWLDGDPASPPPPDVRKTGRNHDWRHLNNDEVISMPDTWEYPWYAAWDLGFHCIPMALIDAEFAKNQLILLVREWYMHPNGQLPAYEWAFSDVNPPVHAWAALRVYKIEKRTTGKADRDFLERVFHKLLLNFTWWVNRKDSDGHNIFQGGFLGLDNIGVFDRNTPLPTGELLEQSDGTAWMGMFCLNMLMIALELARENQVYEDVATKFFEHFLYIAEALNNIAGEGISLWDDVDEFFYDVLHMPDGSNVPLKVRSLVGFIPLLAVETIESELLDKMPAFKARLEWFLHHRPDLSGLISHFQAPGMGERRLLALVRGHRMKRLLKRMLDPAEFLSDHGIRAISKYHAEHPYVYEMMGTEYSVHYEPGVSSSGLFGGNSNWRGPVWFPLNFLLIETLQKFHYYYGDDFLVECPTGSGQYLTLEQIATQLSSRLTGIFLRGEDGHRPVFGTNEIFQTDPHWRDYPLFYEYFHGDTGEGLGASHQTGWTAVVAKLLEQISNL
ncbi:MAG TPA: hypothetical protein VII61_10525 [Ktedonobacteraceae bacterium]